MSETADFADLPDLAAKRVGGVVLFANDEFFAEKENLLAEKPAIFIADRYTDRGKWMDGWETRRRRTPGNDFAVVRLGLPGIVRGVIVDTAHFKGNFPESCAIAGACLDADPTAEELQNGALPWAEILARSALAGDCPNAFAIANQVRCTHLRLDIFPDGGVARLRVHGEPLPRWPALPARLDLASLTNGAWIAGASDRFFGPPHKLCQADAPRGMHDGWETRRRRGPGHDWVIVRLATEGIIERLVIDTSFFKGNAPGSCSLEGCSAAQQTPPDACEWREILPRTALRSDTLHEFSSLAATEPVTHARLNIFPDGGVARLRLLGRPTERGFAAAALAWFNSLPEASAVSELRACCSSTTWARHLAQGRPFTTLGALFAAGETMAAGLAGEDLRDAFSGHPRLGERRPVSAGMNAAEDLSALEQAGATIADAPTLARLAEANHRYEERFGHVFLLCASGKTADEMLAALELRLRNERQPELAIAAGELGKITGLRLRRLMGVTTQ